MQQKEVGRRAYYDYEVPQIKLRKGRAKEVEVKGKKIPAHLRDIATVPQDCPVEEYKPARTREETILDGEVRGGVGRRSKKGSAREKRERVERGRVMYREEEELKEECMRDERVVHEDRREVLRSSVQKVEEVRREDRGPTELLKLK